MKPEYKEKLDRFKADFLRRVSETKRHVGGVLASSPHCFLHGSFGSAHGGWDCLSFCFLMYISPDIYHSHGGKTVKTKLCAQ